VAGVVWVAVNVPEFVTAIFLIFFIGKCGTKATMLNSVGFDSEYSTWDKAIQD